MGGRALGLRSEYGWLAAELVCAGLEPGAVERRAGWTGLCPSSPRAQGAPRPRPARAPRMRRGARARAPALPVPARPGPSFCPISQPRVCPESRRSRRELSNKVLYVIGTWFSALKWRCRGQNFLPGLRPGPRGRTGPLAGYRVCWGVPPRTSMESPVHAAYAPLLPYHALRAHAHAAAPSVIHCMHFCTQLRTFPHAAACIFTRSEGSRHGACGP